MKFEKLKLHKYKPFLHGGNTTIEIDLLENVVPIIGNNGSGKSSLMRALSVFPPVSSDFEVGGYKELHVTHNGSKYVLKSMFQKGKGVHNFILDGEELNLSENSTAQISLCETHLGMSNLIRDLTSGNLNISKITRAARKDILLACYPSDLTFVLNHHKKIASRLRGVKSNIKMMNVRLQEVSDKLMDDEEYKSLSKLNDDINEFQSNIDSWIYRFTQDIESHKQMEQYDSTLTKFDKSEFDRKRQSLLNQLQTVPNDIIFSNEDPSMKVDVIKSSLPIRESALSDMKSRIDKLVKEIDEYEELANDDIDSEIVKTKQELKGITDTINASKLDSNLPVINLPDNHESILVDMNEHIVRLHSINTTLIPSSKIKDLESKLYSINLEGNSVMVEVNRLQKQLSSIESKISKQKAMSYNTNCSLPCQLKDNFNASINELETEKSEIVKTKKTYDDKVNVLRSKKESIVKQLSGPRQVIASIEYMESFYNQHAWCSHIAPTLEEFVSKLNDNASNVHNSISRVFANSHIVNTIEELQKEAKDVNYRLKVLVETKLPTKQLIAKGLVDKKASLNKLQDKYIKQDKEYTEISKSLSMYTKLATTRSEFKSFSNDTLSRLNASIIQAKIDDLNAMISDLKQYKQAALTKQSEIATVLKEQSHLRIRRDEEILPSLSKLKVEQDRLVVIEAALSPNSGIPHIHMTRFINSVFRTANGYIEEVWNYELKYKELSEEKTLDFNFPISLYDKGGVKDVSMCSKGEQEMLNLAFTLALCVHMRIGIKFPIRLDEVDSGFAAAHRDNLLTLLSTLIRQGLIKQLILVNHFSSLFTAFANSQVICLNPEGIAVPSEYNEGVSIN